MEYRLIERGFINCLRKGDSKRLISALISCNNNGDKIKSIISSDSYDEIGKYLIRSLDTTLSTYLTNEIDKIVYKILSIHSDFFWRTLNIDDAEEFYSYEVFMLTLLKNSMLKARVAVVRPIIKKYLVSDESVLRKVAFYVINKRFQEFRELFFAMDNNPFCFDEKYELYYLIDANCEKLTKSEIHKLVYWIEISNFHRDYLPESEARLIGDFFCRLGHVEFANLFDEIEDKDENA